MVLKRQNGLFFSLSVQNTVIGKHSPTLQKNSKFRTMAKNPKLIQKHGFLFFLRQTSGFNGNAALDS